MKRITASILIAGLALWAHYAILRTVLDHWSLRLGLIDFPTGGFMEFTAIWAVFGTLAALALCVGFMGVLGRPRFWARLRRELLASRDVYWWLGGAVLAMVAVVAVRIYLLHQMPLTDDESAYQFGAELLASGRLWVPSHPMKGFLDRMFFINDGRYFPIYFWGWPALMVPGVWLKIPGFMGAIYSGLTVPALFLTARRLWGRGWARFTVVLYLVSPFLLAQAATQMSQTAEIFALAWALYLFLCSRQESARPWTDLFFATGLGVAFWIRPISAVGLGGALAILWLVDRLRARPVSWRRVLAFCLPAIILAGLFLLVQKELYGSPWKTGYRRQVEYLKENHYRFSSISQSRLQKVVLPGFDFVAPSLYIARFGSGMYRLNFDLMGWPMGLFLVALAIGERKARLLWWMAAGGCIALFLQRDAGIDTYGPVHFAELAIPVLLLLTGAARRQLSWRWPAEEGSSVSGIGPNGWRIAAPSLMLAGVLVAWVGYVPIRWYNVNRVVDNIEQPLIAANESAIHHAVIFGPYPFVPPCRAKPSRHFVFTPPENDPDLTNDRLWFYHQSLSRDRQFMQYFPDRTGYLLIWTKSCDAVLAPLDAVREGPPVSGSGGRPGPSRQNDKTD